MEGSSKRLKISPVDHDFVEVVDSWLHEVCSDYSDEELESNHSSESEVGIEPNKDCLEAVEKCDKTEPSTSKKKKFYYGKNRFKWCSQELISRFSRTLKRNITMFLPGIRGPLSLEKTASAESIWKHLITDEMLQNVVRHTNKKLDEVRANYKDMTSSYLKATDLIEIKAFIGALFLTSIFKSNAEDLRSIFATDGSGREIFRCITSLNRFDTLLTCIRFDDKTDRHKRSLENRAAAISDFFDNFVRNSQSLYCLGDYVCVDEMLVAFRGRCKFRMYMPNKPSKYGIKIVCLTDARNNYFFNGYIYTGKGSDSETLQAEEKRMKIPSQSIIRLCKPIFGSNRNVTADNWFSSVEIVEYLLKNNLTYLGTMKKNKGEIPIQFLPKRNRAIGTTYYGFTKNMTLLSYQTKPTSGVILISSMHHKRSDTSKKPEMIEDYNLTKGGVDALDEKCSLYSCSRRSQRWPLTIFFRIIDISGINSFILYNMFPGHKTSSRYDFLKSLAYELIRPEMLRRLDNPKVPRGIKDTIRRILDVKEEHKSKPDNKILEPRKYCGICPRSLKRKTQYPCEKCGKPVCLQCASKVCPVCKEQYLE